LTDPGYRAAVRATLARNLRAALDAAGMTPAELARAVWGEASDGSARNRCRISLYLAEKQLPRADALRRMAEVLGAAPGDLLAEGREVPKAR
jgi:transcriptional regulator with XRE-family HTH domain